MKLKQRIQIRVSGRGKIDGYAEMIVGMFALSGLTYSSEKMTIKRRPDGTNQIYVTLVLSAPPLGHLGDLDIAEADGDDD